MNVPKILIDFLWIIHTSQRSSSLSASVRILVQEQSTNAFHKKRWRYQNKVGFAESGTEKLPTSGESCPDIFHIREFWNLTLLFFFLQSCGSEIDQK